MAVHIDIEDGVGQLVLHEPPLNILTRALMGELREGLARLRSEPTLRVVLLRAEGKHFSAGASVEEHLPPEVETMIPEFMETIGAVQSFSLPVIAAVHGRCLGGAMELALAADLVVAGEGALFGVPEIQLGVFPPAACIQLLEKGPAGLAAELIFTGQPLGASELARAGLIRRVVPDEALMDTALEIAGSIAGRSGAALRAAKSALAAGRRGWEASAGRVTEIYLQDLMRTRDATEGLRAFVEKRKPEWSHA